MNYLVLKGKQNTNGLYPLELADEFEALVAEIQNELGNWHRNLRHLRIGKIVKDHKKWLVG